MLGNWLHSKTNAKLFQQWKLDEMNTHSSLFFPNESDILEGCFLGTSESLVL